jgi:hypothetical protein
MKADVLPRSPSVPKLRIPSWVPRAVAASAREAYAVASQREPDEFGFAEVVKKYLLLLVRDPRMRAVWHELCRRHRNGTYMHPATPLTTLADDDERQGAAMVELFGAALKYAMAPGITFTRWQVEWRRADLLEQARALRIDAAMGALLEAISFGGERDIWTDERRRRLLAAAEAYDAIAAETYAADTSAALDRERGDRAARWFARAVSRQFQELFGPHFYGLTAIVASVVLGREIEARDVRQWCSPPCG